MPSIAADEKRIERGQRMRTTFDGTEITVAWIDTDGTVTDQDGDEWNATDLVHM